MGQQIPNGSRLEIASVMAASLTVTVATNAANAVLTVTNALAAGSYVEFTSGWAKATNRVYRLSAATGTTVTLEGLDTTSTANFPAGAGIGSIRACTTFVPVLQILDFSTEGGEAQTGSFKFLEALSEAEFITGVSSSAYVFNIADDISLAGYIALKAASDSSVQTAFKMTLPSGGIIVSAVKPFVNQNPKTDQDQLITVSARLSIQNGVQRYIS
jgi:Phage tail tube protein, TTP